MTFTPGMSTLTKTRLRMEPHNSKPSTLQAFGVDRIPLSVLLTKKTNQREVFLSPEITSY